MFLKMEMISFNEIPSRSKRPNQLIWPLAVQRKYDNIIGEIRMSEQTRLSRDEYQRRRNYSPQSDNAESFHCAIGPILNMAQVFGIFPVCGVRSSSPSKLRFSMISLLSIYSFCIIVMLFFATAVSVIFMLKSLNSAIFETRGFYRTPIPLTIACSVMISIVRLSREKWKLLHVLLVVCGYYVNINSDIGTATVGAVFYGNSLLGSILFFWLSWRWSSFQCEYRAMEQYIDSNSTEKTSLRWKFFFISSVVLLLALVEHILSMLSNIENTEWCENRNSTFRDFLKIYCVKSNFFIFSILDYNFGFGLYIFLISKVATFTWNFTDLFLMLMSTGLAERYRSLNKKLAITSKNSRSPNGWCKLREDYAILSSIVKRVDNYISPIIFLSFANNLYFICLQLLNGLSISEGSSILNAIYFFGSFAFLIGRTAAVTLLTARIYDESKQALPHLYNCSTSSYGIETQRLQYQLATDDVALTGLRFFSITRNFMLAMAGAVITYEIVLLQFNGKS